MGYQMMEKVALTLVNAAHLRQYFQSHRITIKADCPIAKILRKPELTGRVMAWSIELIEYEIVNKPKRDIRAQVLANFFLHNHVWSRNGGRCVWMAPPIDMEVKLKLS